MRQLIGEDFAPWTEKARWALDHHAVRYAFEPYEPLMHEPWLRLRTRNLTRKATVPVLIADREVADDSFSIAQWAERHGDGAPLFTDARAVAEWNRRSERGLRAGRALFFTRLASDREAQSDHLPPFVPRSLRPLLRPMVLPGLSYLRIKHGIDRAFVDGARATLEAELASLREALAGGDHLLGSFSYADVAMAVVCQFVRPVDDRFIRLTPANRACWTEPELAKAFEDVIAWRDALYAKHRSVVAR